jgi:hypothetical protein
VLPGRELLEVEEVVASGAGYFVVEKVGGAGIEAEKLDPRD